MSNLMVGTHRGLQQCSSPTGRIAIMALDHRQNLRRMLHPDNPGSATYAELVEFKRTAVRALSDLATGVLLDPELGAAQCIADGSLPGHVGLVIALEATGYEGAATERRSRLLQGWSAGAARNLGASACKLLVYYHPDAANRAAQEALVSEAISQCRAVDLPIFVETLCYSVKEGAPFEGEDRRRVIVRTAATMSALGADVLKLQFPYGPEVTDRARWRDACAEVTQVAGRPWVLLSGDNSPEAFVELAEVACREGASGIACGRGIWTEAPALPEEQRERFFRTVARERLKRLNDIVETHARPWTSAYPPIAAELEGWYRK
ncbi:MAG TPA: tagatose 1,6-diphosphate aldolase [Patescibacteria group bacterium]|nr:tagatose 1,6-diphosphate aldolase [Patescibacteria group bacterium]